MRKINEREDTVVRGETHSYTVNAPDTLDLAERARVAVNGLTGALDPELDFMPFHGANFYANPAYMNHEGGHKISWTGDELWGKQVEALIKMRIMSGSEQNIEMDAKTLAGMASCLEDDGIWYAKVADVDGDKTVDAPDHAPLLAQARVMRALMIQHEVDGEAKWLDMVRSMVGGLQRVACYREDYAYYPVHGLGGTLCMPRSGWPNSDEPQGVSLHATFIEGQKNASPGYWHASASHTVFSYGTIVRMLCQWYRMTGDEKAFEFAGKLVRFILKERTWKPEAKPKAVVAADHAQFEGHVHANCWGFLGLLDYAAITNNDRIKAFVRDGYEYIRTFGIARIGLLGEGCTVGDMTHLAIRLSDLGVGDYWEDVDQYVRNHLVEIQQLRADLIEPVPLGSPERAVRSWETTERIIERNIGSLSDDATHVNMLASGGIFCCTENGLLGYYHAWEAIVRCADGAAQVNLLLNRASPWLDVDSYLPYQGKVVIKNKTARRLSVRLPRWVDQGAVQASVDGGPAGGFWVGRYLVLEDIGGKKEVSIEFPMAESTETYCNGWEGVTLSDHHTERTLSFLWEPPEELTRYTFRFKGNTVVDVSPREEGLGYPIYLRDHYKSNTAPMKEVKRYISRTV